MIFEQFRACLLCDSEKLSPMPVYAKDYLVRCEACNFIFSQRKPTQPELQGHYGNYPRDIAISEITQKRYDVLLDMFEAHRKTNNLIDVGCGDGFFLEAAKKRKWNVFGTEYTDTAIEVCKRKGIHMTTSPLDPSKYQPGFFDVITSFEVIEHINTPQLEVKSFHSILRKHGVVYVTTPNFNSLSRIILKAKWNVIEYPEHLCYYTRQTLTSLFRENNFKTITTSTTNISVKGLKEGLTQQGTPPIELNADEALRQRTESSVLFRTLKSSINLVLNLTGTGDALKALFQKM